MMRTTLWIAACVLAGALAGCGSNAKKDDLSLKSRLLGPSEEDIKLAKIHNIAGLTATSKGDFATAAREFGKAVELDDKSEYYNNLGRCYYWLARYNDAIAAFNRAKELGLNTPDLYTNMGDAYRQQNQGAQAVEMYRKAISIDMNFVRAHFELGDYYLKRGNYKSAEERLSLVLKLDPGDNRALLDRLIVYRMTGRYEEAYTDMVTLDRRGFDVKDDLRDQIMDGVEKKRKAEAMAG